MATIEKRLAKDGKVSYRVKIRLKGYPTQSETFKLLTQAKKWEKATESAINEGRYFKSNEAKKHTLTEMLDRYIKNIIPNKSKNLKHRYNQRVQLEWWKSELGHHILDNVTPSLIAECRDQLANKEVRKGQKRSPSTVNRYLAALSHAFTIAVKEWGWIEDNPLRKVTKPKESRGRVRYLSEAERTALLATCLKSKQLYLYTLVILAISTGARRAELLNLRWENIDFNRSLITLYETKNDEIRLLPLTGLALQLMQEHVKNKREGSNFVFPNRKGTKPGDIRSVWKTALKNAEITNFKWHDLRHTTASYLAMNGASSAEIAEVLGHKTLSMVKRYAHLSEAHTASVVASMNTKIFGDTCQ